MNILILIVFSVFLIVFFMWKINYPAIKGKIGELNISSRLSSLPKDKYIVLNDMFFKSGVYTTQIDHIIISIYGIFVVETKNYKGWIIGNSGTETWTQKLGRYKFPLFNPIFQNESHIRFLKRYIIESAENYIYPVVVFLSANRLILKGECECVLLGNELNKYIKSYKVEVLSWENCIQIASIIKRYNIQDKKFKQIHIENIAIAKVYSEERIRNGVCPRCGGNLILRNGGYGSFLGCSNFPICKYNHDVS